MGIKSSMNVAGNISASFSQSASALTAVKGSSSGAARTNISGNKTAQATFTTFEKDLKELAASIVSAGNNIHSVAKDFSEIDLKAAQQFNRPSSPMSRWFK